jgi:nitroimidazol reductase NimA-like FMN-containing flavoprotein (pyridoxamine 5'-phosphate oxidase superfamily)
MVIREMSRDECLRMLAGAKLARLGCAHNNQPYVVPVSLVYHLAEDGVPCLYGVTTPGQKVEWMRANPLVCVEADEFVTHDQWTSVVAFGRYEELPETPADADDRFRAPERLFRSSEQSSNIGEVQTEGGRDERQQAFQLLKTHIAWWEPGWAAWVARAAHRDPTEPYQILYYKIRIDRVTGHESTRNSRDQLASGKAM